MEETKSGESAIEAATRERLRFAAHLHDGPIQRLTAVALTLDLFVMRLEAGDVERARAYALQARADLAAETAALRGLMTELRKSVDP